MTALAVVATIIFTMIVLSVIGNFIQLFTKSKQLKAQNQTPLIGQSVVVIVAVAIAEVIVSALLLKLAAILGVLGLGIVGVIILFLILFYVKLIVAYLVTWGIWSLYVKRSKKQELNKLKQDQQEALTK